MSIAVTVRQLEYLAAVAEHGHFGRAAAACHVSQPGLSLQVQQAEQQLGVRLFERSRRGTTTTAAGRRVVERARRILEELDALADEARAGSRPFSGPLRLGVIPTVAPYLLPAVLRELRPRFPELRLYLREDVTERLAEQLRDGRLDLVVAALPVAGLSAESMVLYREPFDLLVAADHPLARRRSLSESALSGADVLLLEDGHCLRDQALAVCRALGAREAEGLRATSLRTLAQMVAGGVGVTLVPRLAGAVEAAGEPGLRVRRLTPPPSRTVGLLWRSASARGAEFAELGALIRDTAAGALARQSRIGRSSRSSSTTATPKPDSASRA